MTEAHVRAAQAARTSYGRLLALLAAPSRDILGAEDALSAAFEQALVRWPVDGVPKNPDGWLLTVARNRQRDEWKSAAQRTSVPFDPNMHTRIGLDDIDPDAVEDRRLQLMLVCTHPAIDPTVHTPLMLDVVMGFGAKEIARVFALPAPTLAARLVRAKRRIREAGISFDIPDRSVLPSRIDAVLAAVYGAFAIDWHGSGTEVRENFLDEAVHLAQTLAALLPGDPEVRGLAALVNLSAARVPARFDDDGVLVPLPDQDPRRWNEALIARGEAHLRAAHSRRVLGRFQLEAAIQAVHCARRTSPNDSTDWQALAELHEALQSVFPTTGGAVARAAVIAEVDSPAAGLESLDAIENSERFQPAWATRARLLERLDCPVEARVAYDKAVSLTTDTATREYLIRRRERA
ncbi:RNA polymerase sigma factor [Rhodococcus sp. NPDC058521]|uniref:RNA polymerase sigma factor n=1 Tax=Rhodococcus sp. NPDC058521 TaxID=3346536 RepID=UPI00364BC041